MKMAFASGKNNSGAGQKMGQKIKINRKSRTGSHIRNVPSTDQNARLNYERYLNKAQSEAQSGNLVEAENCYQHAEHYFRTLNNPAIASH
jgi:hypothetical protein